MSAPAPATARREPSVLGFRLFIGLSMASAAISIDLILPAFVEIRRHFGLPAGSAATAGLITAFFLGFACGPIPFGLVSDRIGRKPTLLIACVLFVVGVVGASSAPTLAFLMWARFVWGVGAAGMRVATTAMIRDRYSDAEMAREMSFAMTVFITVPVVAPLLGAVLVKVVSWRVVLLLCGVFALVIGTWSTRLPESLAVERRQPFGLARVGEAARAIAHNRTSFATTLAITVLFGPFSSYLASSERLVGDVFQHRSWFPYVFGGTAIAMGLTTLLVGPRVERIGLQRLIVIASAVYAGAAVALFAVSLLGHGRPNFVLYLVPLTVVLGGTSLSNSTLNAAAMSPVGHVAGTAAALIFTLSTAVGALVGAFIDNAFDDTARPSSLAFAIAGCLALGLVLWGRARPGDSVS